MLTLIKSIFGSKEDRKKPDPNKNYCIDCGACCAYFKVHFSNSESSANGGTVPAEKITFYSKDRSIMKGREKFRDGTPCIALEGEIGKAVSCNIYAQRSSVCREFDVLLPNGDQNPRCRKARVYYGLPPDLE